MSPQYSQQFATILAINHWDTSHILSPKLEHDLVQILIRGSYNWGLRGYVLYLKTTAPSPAATPTKVAKATPVAISEAVSRLTRRCSHATILSYNLIV